MYLGPADAAVAFSSGAVDGWSVWDPYLAIAQSRDNGRVIAWSHAIGDENATIVVARNGFLDQHAEAVRLLYQTLIAENKWATANPLAAAKLWAADAKQDDATATLLSKRAPVTYIGVNDQVTLSLTHVAQWFADQKIIPNAPDVANFVYRAT